MTTLVQDLVRTATEKVMWTPALPWALKLAQESELAGCIGYCTIEEEHIDQSGDLCQ